MQHYLCLFALGQVDLYDGRAREADARYRAQAAALKKSMLMRVETRFVLFGYPGLAMLCFLAAAAGGFWLVINIFVQDKKSRRTR